MTAVAVVGLGVMGSRIAARLVAAGHEVTVEQVGREGLATGRARGVPGGEASGGREPGEGADHDGRRSGGASGSDGRTGRSRCGRLVAVLRCPYQRAVDNGPITEADNPARMALCPGLTALPHSWY
jgi:glycine/D-amino acid oxidase-like deaminating enzyme